MKTIRMPLSAGLLVLGPLLAATMRDHKTAIAAARRNELDPVDMLELTCTLAHACARRVDPAATLSSIEDVVDLENFGAVFGACWGVSMPEPLPGDAPVGEALQAGNPSS